MKKTTILKSLIVAAGMLVGTSAWAEDVYTSVYTRAAVTDWTDADKTEWNASSEVEINATNGIGANANQTATYVSKAFSVTNNAKVKYEVDWTFATATGRTNNWNWIQFGSFLRIAVNSTYNMQVSTDAGSSWNTTTLGYYKNGTYTKHIEIIFDTQLKQVEKFTFDGTDRTELVSGNFSSASFNTVSTGFVRGGSVSWNLANYVTTIAVSQAEQAAAAEATYTINYIFNGSTIKTDEGTSVVGATINAETPIVVEDVKYFAADDAVTSITLSEGENVLNVDLRLAGVGTVKINAVDGEGTVLKVFSAERTEGDAASVLYYTRGVEYDGKYYLLPAANGNGVNYGRSLAYGAEDVNITYTLDESIRYYGEENVLNKSRSFAQQGAVPERASGGDWQRMYASSQVWTDALEPGIYTFEVSGRNQSSSNVATLAVQIRLNDGTFVETGKEVSLATAANAVMSVSELTVPAGASIALVETTGNNSNIGLDYVIAYKTADYNETKTISAAGYATYYSANALDFTNVEGLTAYVATIIDGTQVRFAQVDKVPAQTGVLLKGAEGEYQIPVVADGGSATSALVGVLEATKVPAGSFVLMDGAQGVGFYKTASEFTVGANTAYLPAQTTVTARSFIGFDGESSTGISAVENAVLSTEVYDLQGRRVAQPTKGLYIMNGKKTVVR